MLKSAIARALSVLAVLFIATPAAADVQPATWVGGFEINGAYRPLTLTLSKSNGADHAEIRSQYGSLSLGELTMSTLNARHGALEIVFAEADGDTHRFAGRVEGQMFRGAYSGPRGEAPFAFLRSASAPIDMNALIGLYSTDDRRFSVYAANGTLVLVDFSSGETRALYPQPSGHYVFGPGLRMPLPLAGEVRFERDALVFTSGGDSVRAARLPTQRESVRFAHGEIALAGDILLPPGDGPFPGVVLGHGGGPTVRGNFMVDFFLAHGFAVLTFDKRGSGESSGEWRASFDDYAGDILAAVSTLRAHARVRADRVGVWGPSQAGWILPLAASRDPYIAFVMLQGAPGVTLLDQELFNGRMRLREAGVDEVANEEIARFREIKYRALLGPDGMAAFEAALPQAREQSWFAYTGAGLPNEQFYRPNLLTDPLDSWRNMRQPALVLIGTADTVVPPEASAERLGRAFSESGRDNLQLVVLPGAEHEMMLAAPWGGVAARRGFSPRYFELMDEFLTRVQD